MTEFLTESDTAAAGGSSAVEHLDRNENRVEDAPASLSSSASSKELTKDMETSTAVSEESAADKHRSAPSTGPIVSSSKKTRPPYKFDPNKITLRFLFANKDGLTVTLECNPSDTIGEVKGSLMSVWPEGLPHCAGGDQLRLVCMGKGYLMPDTRTLQECEIPVFKTHPTPINVSVRQEVKKEEETTTKVLKKKESNASGQSNARGGGGGGAGGTTRPGQQQQQPTETTSGPISSSSAVPTQTTVVGSQGCGCILL